MCFLCAFYMLIMLWYTQITSLVTCVMVDSGPVPGAIRPPLGTGGILFAGCDRRGRCSIGEHPDDLRQITVMSHQKFSDDLLICKLEFK